MDGKTPGGSGELTSYTELASLLASLPLLVREVRRQRRLSQRDAGTQVGCSFSTISRLEAGKDCALSNAIAVLRWIDRSAEPRCGSRGMATPEGMPDWGGCIRRAGHDGGHGYSDGSGEHDDLTVGVDQ